MPHTHFTRDERIALRAIVAAAQMLYRGHFREPSQQRENWQGGTGIEGAFSASASAGRPKEGRKTGEGQIPYRKLTGSRTAIVDKKIRAGD
jgi:hypothetical protein